MLVNKCGPLKDQLGGGGVGGGGGWFEEVAAVQLQE